MSRVPPGHGGSEQPDPHWHHLLASAPLPPDPGFTLRVLTALPPARGRGERLRSRILVLAALVAALLVSLAVAPTLVAPSSLLAPVLLCLAGGVLAFWTVLTVAD